MNQYPVKYSPAPEIEYSLKKGKSKYTKMFMAISFVFLVLIFFFTLIIYSSLYGHETLYNKHYKVLKAKIGSGVAPTRVTTQGCTDQLSTNFKDIDALRNYHSDEHKADFLFCLLLLIACATTFFVWVLVFISRGKQGGLNSKGAVAFVVFLFFCIVVIVFVYFIYFMCEGEDNIDSLKTIQSNLKLILNSKCYVSDITSEVSVDYMLGYTKSIINIIRPFVITSFIVSCIYFLIWIGLLGISASKKALCNPL